MHSLENYVAIRNFKWGDYNIKRGIDSFIDNTEFMISNDDSSDFDCSEVTGR